MTEPAWLPATIAVLGVVFDIAIRVFAIVYVPINRRPTTATAWLLAIFLIPYVGFLLFLLFGSTKLPRRRREKQQEINSYIVETTEGMERVTRDHPWPLWLDSVIALNRTLGAMPLVGGNTAELHSDYARSMEAMVEAVDGAHRWVHAEFYITSLDATTEPFFLALENARRRGVTVRVLMDHIASRGYPGYRRTRRRLTRMGVEWQLMLPVQPLRGRYQRPDLRNHRKLLVIDGQVAFTGSQNMIERGYQRRGNHRRGLQWKDFMVRFEGPIVAGVNALFVTDWYSETDELLLREADPVVVADDAPTVDCQVVPSGPGFDGENNLRLFNTLLYNAQERIIITSPYFVPDESMLYAVTTAAQRGIEVQLFVSEIGDQAVVYHAQRSYYEALLRAGVRIFLYRSPTVLHAKHLTVDDEVAVIGSSNMDMRSFSLNLEISVMIRGRSFVRQLREVEQSYRDASRELLLDEWLVRPFRSKVLDNVARLTSAVQ